MHFYARLSVSAYGGYADEIPFAVLRHYTETQSCAFNRPNFESPHSLHMNPIKISSQINQGTICNVHIVFPTCLFEAFSRKFHR